VNACASSVQSDIQQWKTNLLCSLSALGIVLLHVTANHIRPCFYHRTVYRRVSKAKDSNSTSWRVKARPAKDALVVNSGARNGGFWFQPGHPSELSLVGQFISASFRTR